MSQRNKETSNSLNYAENVVTLKKPQKVAHYCHFANKHTAL